MTQSSEPVHKLRRMSECVGNEAKASERSNAETLRPERSLGDGET
jgi:hypothetical protein